MDWTGEGQRLDIVLMDPMTTGKTQWDRSTPPRTMYNNNNLIEDINTRLGVLL